MAIVEYKLCPQYQALGVSWKEWFKRNEKHHVRILKLFEQAQLVCDVEIESNDASPEIALCNPSSSNPLSKTSLSDSIQTSMWDKVKSHMNDPSSYKNAPGMTDYSCILVKSQSDARPHFVQKTSRMFTKSV